MARSMLSLGMLAAAAFEQHHAQPRIHAGSPPPSLAAIVISLAQLGKNFPALGVNRRL